MHVTARDPDDLDRLAELIRKEPGGGQRDRFRMVLLSLRGEEKLRIAEVLGVAKSTVEHWVYRYRDGGIDALRPKKQKGAAFKLPRDKHEAFRRRMLAGPLDKDGVCTLRGKDAVRILNEDFSVKYTLAGTYDLLHRLGLSCLKPRPRHERNDPAAMERFKKDAPLLSGPSASGSPGRR